jgi:hypothetical protein
LPDSPVLTEMRCRDLLGLSPRVFQVLGLALGATHLQRFDLLAIGPGNGYRQLLREEVIARKARLYLNLIAFRAQ